MRLEFVGPPGAGKSTIMRACGHRKPQQLEPSRHSGGPFMRFVRECYAGAEIKREGHLVTLRQYRRARAADLARGWHWYSELLAQRGLSLALARPQRFDLIDRYFALMPMPALTVVVSGDPELIIERNRMRAAERGQDDRSASVSYLCDVTAFAMPRLKARGRVLVLDCAATAEENAARVLDHCR